MTTTRVLVILSLTTTPSRVFLTPTVLSSPPSTPSAGCAPPPPPLPGRPLPCPPPPLRRPREAPRPLSQDGPGPRQVPPGDRHPRRVLGHAHRELEPQVEELLSELAGLLLQLLVGHLTPLVCLHGRLSASQGPHARHELGLDPDLLGGQTEPLPGRRLVHALHLVEDAAGLDHRHPELRVALALAHPRLRRLLGHRLV